MTGDSGNLFNGMSGNLPKCMETIIGMNGDSRISLISGDFGNPRIGMSEISRQHLAVQDLLANIILNVYHISFRIFGALELCTF
jgi:hypothetical protein